MIKLFVTGDIHIGLKFDNYETLKEELIQSRFDCIKRCVQQAEKEKCDFFVITGDTFDNIRAIKKGDIEQFVDIIKKFSGRVLILPGNHDYYTDEEKVWMDFESVAKDVSNIILFTEYRERQFDVGEENITFYPAFCDAKHSESNKLEWIKQAKMNDDSYHVGVAHGAIEGLSADNEGKYFLMRKNELNSISVDTWLVGHTHIPYPEDLSDKEDKSGYKIFNAGTPEQTDLANNTEGCCFVITLDKKNGETIVKAHKFVSGKIRYFDINVKTKPEVGLKGSIEQEIIKQNILKPENSIVRLSVAGTVKKEELLERQQICDSLTKKYKHLIWKDNLCEEITKEKIAEEFPEYSISFKLLNALEDPLERQMAYNLIKEYQKEDR